MQHATSVYGVGFIYSASDYSYQFPQSQSVGELDFLYGLGFEYGTLFSSLSIGISYNVYDTHGNFLRDTTLGSPQRGTTIATIYQPKHFTSVGIPVQLQAMFDPTPVVGLGALLYANLNTQYTLWGILGCLQIGWF